MSELIKDKEMRENYECAISDLTEYNKELEQENQRLKRILKEVATYAANNSLFSEIYEIDEILSLCNSTE